MALYTKKKGEYQRLTNEQIRRLRRTSEVNELLDLGRSTSLVLRGLAMWMKGVEKNSKKFDAAEWSIVLPQMEKLTQRAASIDAAINKIGNM